MKNKKTPAQKVFQQVNPKGWRIQNTRIKPGAQASVCVVRHVDGREGVFRTLAGKGPEEQYERFNREIPILASKLNHKGVVRLFDWSEDPKLPWYISELGTSFEPWWKQKRLELQEQPEELANIAISILELLISALAACHEAGVVHRDIKPKNIVLLKNTDEIYPVLIDFGIAFDEEKERLTPLDGAVGNAQFSPDMMRDRMEEVVPWVDVFAIGQLMIWMLGEKSAKSHWQGTIHWKYVRYPATLPEELKLSVQAFTAACSHMQTSPRNGEEAVALLQKLFEPPSINEMSAKPPRGIAIAKRRAFAENELQVVEMQDEIKAAAPLAKLTYGQLRDAVLQAFNESASSEENYVVSLDEPFAFQETGAQTLLIIAVGPLGRQISVQVRVKIVTRADPSEFEIHYRDLWLSKMCDQSICFTFAIEGGVAAAGDSRYKTARWITLQRDGGFKLHPMSAGDLSEETVGDLGGLVTDVGKSASLSDVEKFVTSVICNTSYWRYILDAAP